MRDLQQMVKLEGTTEVSKRAERLRRSMYVLFEQRDSLGGEGGRGLVTYSGYTYEFS